MFILVIGLSIEEPSINRTTAKAWVSLYRKLEIISNLGGVIIHTSLSNIVAAKKRPPLDAQKTRAVYKRDS